MAVSGDRRNRPRVALHWPVRLFRQSDGPSVETTTENLSSEGLYCIISEPFKTGERLRCEIILPAATLGLEAPVVLECHVTIRRMESLHPGFGLGCQIEDYSLRPPIQV
jgi:hypothetical protein